ncbi:hypothetical protein [Streptomyces microflavus]|uniref:hypothetical protein n=1 Tax=Streptomyces microflavus TaxID=1919 RepID=UPI0033BF1C74
MHTYQLAKPFNINLSNSEIERLKAARLEVERTEDERPEAKYQTLEEVVLLAPGGNAGRKAGQPG